MPVELVNDLNSLLVLFYKVLRDRRSELVDAMVYTPYSRAEFELCKNDDPELDQLERARRFMVRSNQTFVGGSGGWVSTYKASSGHSNASKWMNYVTRLSEVATRLQGVQIENQDALEILTRAWVAHDPRMAVYIDPPYLESTRNGSKYINDAGEDQHHLDMLDLAKKIDGPVVISSYNNSLYSEALEGWTKIEVATLASSQAGRGSIAKRTEVLWCNSRCQLPKPVVEPIVEPIVELVHESGTSKIDALEALFESESGVPEV